MAIMPESAKSSTSAVFAYDERGTPTADGALCGGLRVYEIVFFTSVDALAIETLVNLFADDDGCESVSTR
jgi:hypothetical protein